MLYLYQQRVGIAMGQWKLLLVSLFSASLPLTIAPKSHMGSRFLIHRLDALWVAHSTHLLLEMSKKEVWTKECCLSCSSPHEQVMVGKTGSSKFCPVSSLPPTKTSLCPSQVPVLVHTAPSSPWHLFLQRQRLQLACDQEQSLWPSALSLFLHGDTGCSAILTSQLLGRALCSSPLQPSPELSPSPGCAEQTEWKQHVPVASVPLSPDCLLCASFVPPSSLLCRDCMWGWACCVYWAGQQGACRPGMC